jgi:uncharacterized membrane protein YbhN (UPF0104 family)
MRSRPLGLAAKILVSALLVAFLARRWGGDAAFRDAIGRLDVGTFLAAEAVVAGGLLLSALRWRILLAARGVPLGLAKAVRLYFVGYFFNLFLPTTVGGDVVRALGVGGAPLPVVAGTILVERILGFGCLLAVGLAACHGAPHLGIVRPSLWAAALVYAVGLLLLARLPLGWADDPGAPRYLRGLARTARKVRGGGYPPRALAAALVLSLAWQLALVLANGLLSRGLGGVAPLGSLLALVPVIQAVGMIPVSFGGLGVREMGYEFFFRRSGFDPAGAVALAACFLGVTIAVALKGGILYMAFPLRERT